MRTTCALLLLRPGDLVATDRFVDELWPEQPPADARALVRGYVSRLRRALRRGPSHLDRVVTHKPGYLLRVEDQELDLHRFDQLLTEARAATQERQPERALALLDRAHRLWRGDPLADVPPTSSIRAAATWLTERRLTAVEERFGATLAAGRHEHVLAELTEFVAAHPLRERPAGQLMLALYRCGRQAEALACYQTTRRDLAREVGVTPGVELRRLHERILAADPSLLSVRTTAVVATRPVPRQLPRDLPALVGREQEVEAIRAALGTAATAGPGPVVVIHGPAGVGKSALATHAAHDCASQYPHGQLHVDLCGFTAEVAPLSTTAALGQLLRALGVPGGEIPTGVEEAAGLFRSLLADRRVLILLDNAANAAQVRSLLPSSPGSAVLITSRERLPALEGAAHHELRPLTPDSAAAVLDGLVSGDRIAEDPEATRRLVGLCDHLPLGLRVAAARLNSRPHWAVRDLVNRLADERQRLAELAVDDVALRSSLAESHAALRRSDSPVDQAAELALRLFGTVPVTNLDVPLTAALLASSLPEADRAIGRLLDAHLVEEVSPGCYRMHDLIRLFARGLATDTVAPAAHGTALTNALRHYLATARVAVGLAYPHRVHHPAPDVTAPVVPLTDRLDAREWLDRGRHDVAALILLGLAGTGEQVHLAVWLALALYWYLRLDAGDLEATLALYRRVIVASTTLGDRRAEACAHGSVASFHEFTDQLAEARAHLIADLRICRELGDRFGEQRALGNLGLVHIRRDQPREALPFLNQQLALAGEIGAPIGQAFARYNLGRAQHLLGHLDQAIEQIEAGLAWFVMASDYARQCEGRCLLALVRLDLGEYDRAIALLTQALADARRFSFRFAELRALTLLARACRLSQDVGQARRYAELAATTSTGFRESRVRQDILAECVKLGLRPGA